MEGDERHAVGSAPALGTASCSALAAESPKAVKVARNLFDGGTRDATAARAPTTKTTPAAGAASLPHLSNSTKEGSLRGGNLFQSIAQGIHGLVDRSSLHASAERQPLSREGSRHGPGSGSREGSVRLGLRQPQILPGDVVEGDSAAATPEPAAANPCFAPLRLEQDEEGREEGEEEDGDLLFLRQLDRLRVTPASPAAPPPAAPPPAAPLPLPPPPAPPAPRATLSAPRPVFYDFLRATSGSSPAPRWGHAAAACGSDALVVVGGVGAAVFEDVHVFDAITGGWHEVRTKGPPVQQQQQQQQQQQNRQQQNRQQQQQQQGLLLRRIPSNGSTRSSSGGSGGFGGGDGRAASSSANLSPSSSSSSLNFASRAAPLTASSAASAALFARRDAGPGSHFGAAAAEWPVGSGRVFVFGGRQGRGFLRSAHELDVGRGAWRTLRADAVPDPWGMEGEVGSLLSSAANAASSCSPSPARGVGGGGGSKKCASVGGGPPAVAGATLTAVGDHGLVLFGGAGKKVSGEVWLLRPRSLSNSTAAGEGSGASGSGRRGRGGDGSSSSSSVPYPPYSNDTWIKLDISPDPIEGAPRARHGHTAFLGPCGGSGTEDSLVVFGGAASDGSALNDTWLLDLRTRSWRKPRHPTGSFPPPRARFSHCAALMTTAAEAETGGNSSSAAAAALVFGGCTPEGVFLNDAHVLDLRDWSWSPAVAPAGPPPPPPRYGASATAVGGRLLLYGGSDARQPFGGVVSVVTDFGSDLSAVAGDLLVSSSSHPSHHHHHHHHQQQQQHRPSAAAAVPAMEAEAAAEDAPSSPSLSLAPLSPSFAIPFVAAPPPPLSSPAPAPPTGGSMRSRLADALGRRSAQATAAAAARKAAVAESLFRAERERAEALSAELAAARLLLGEEKAALEEEVRTAALGVSAAARREAESARRAAAAADGARREAELRAEGAERRAGEAERRAAAAAADAEGREQRSVSSRDRDASAVASLRARLSAAEAGRAAAAREAVAARAAADAARRGAARARAEAVAEATATAKQQQQRGGSSSVSVELLEREVSRLQAHARALESALEGAREAALAAVASSSSKSGAGAPSTSSSAAAVAALEQQLSRYRGEPATLASLSPDELRSLEDELVRSARAAAAAAREADAASAAALRAALADREARLNSLVRSSSSSAAAATALAASPPPPLPLPSSSSTAECGICLEREVEVSLDCGHLLCCGCAEEQRARKGRCPFCDAPVTGTRRVFVG